MQKIKSTDVIGIFGQRGSGKSIQAKNIIRQYPQYLIFDPLNEYSKFGKVVYDLKDIDLEKDKKIVFNPIETENNENTHDEVSKFVWDNLPNYCFLTDEMHMYQAKSMTRNFKKLITQGRHRGNGLISVSQRFANVNQTITTQSSHIFLYKLMGRDIETAKTYFGSGIEQKIREMPEYHFLYWNTKANEFSLQKPIPKEICKKLE